jgi:hypothetical protein
MPLYNYGTATSTGFLPLRNPRGTAFYTGNSQCPSSKGPPSAPFIPSDNLNTGHEDILSPGQRETPVAFLGSSQELGVLSNLIEMRQAKIKECLGLIEKYYITN